MIRNIVLASLLSIFVLTGCSGEESTEEANAEFVSDIRDNTNHFDEESAIDIATLGRETCSALERNVAFLDLVDILIDGGVPAADAGYFLGTSIKDFCPDELDDMEISP